MPLSEVLLRVPGTMLITSRKQKFSDFVNENIFRRSIYKTENKGRADLAEMCLVGHCPSFPEELSSRNTGPKMGGRGGHGKQFENQSFDPLVLEKSLYCLLCYLLSILERSVLRSKLLSFERNPCLPAALNSLRL